MGKTLFADNPAMVLAINSHHPGKAAATATESRPVFVAPADCYIIALDVIPQATITGADTNSTNLNLIDKGTAGTGSTELANRDYVSGTNSTGFVKQSIYAPASPLEVSAGNVLAIELEKVGDGLIIPEMLVQVTYRLK